MKCQNCNTINEKNSKFCKNCGSILNVDFNDECIITKGKTSGIICVLMYIAIIILLVGSNTSLYKSISHLDPSNIMVRIWAYSTLFLTFIFFFGIIFFIRMARSNINVTENNVFGQTIFHKFNLAYSDVEEIKLLPFHSIVLKSKRKKYRIFLLKNHEDIYHQINKKLKK